VKFYLKTAHSATKSPPVSGGDFVLKTGYLLLDALLFGAAFFAAFLLAGLLFGAAFTATFLLLFTIVL